MNFTQLPLVYQLQTLIATVFCTFYVLVLLSLVRGKAYKEGSFFALAINMGAIDLVTCVQWYLFTNFRKWGVFSAWLWVWYGNGPWTSWAVWGTFYVIATQATATLLISFNRYAVFLKPLQHVELWKKIMRPAVVIQWVIWLPVFAPTALFTDYKVRASNFSDTARDLFYTVPVVNQYCLFVVFVTLLLVVGASAIAYSIAFTKAHQRRKVQLSSGRLLNSESSKFYKEFKLAICGVVIILINGVGLAFLLVGMVVYEGQPHSIMWIYAIIQDVLAYHSPFMLLLMSSVARKHFRNLFRC